ncbi:natural killer cells antigen CD94 isoform X1 [Osmerus eperlanus]|uniref:natural killer cells antigen CD94 isoform X1 n=1 Tax=Osmerus eperlanus TaxID=29151 RepID=UPI002E118615
MELQDLTPAEDRVEEVVEEEEEEKRQMLDVEVKEDKSCAYNALKTPTEDIYSVAVWPSTKDKADLQIHGKVRVYRALCFLLSLICLVLLFVVIILCVKFPTEALVCPEREREGTEETVVKVEETRQSPPMCSLQKCKAQHPQFGTPSSPCQPCAEGWLLFEDSCFFLSRERQSWEDSRKYCSARGGDLAVITNDRVQNFLTKEGNLLYWIGLRYKAEQWTWVTSAALTKSYWGGRAPVGDCGLLLGNKSTNQSWNASPCFYSSAYICQTQKRHFPLPAALA